MDKPTHPAKLIWSKAWNSDDLNCTFRAELEGHLLHGVPLTQEQAECLIEMISSTFYLAYFYGKSSVGKKWRKHFNSFFPLGFMDLED